MCHVDKNKNQVCIKYVDAVINDDVLDIKLALREDDGRAEGGGGGAGWGERNRKIVLFK